MLKIKLVKSLAGCKKPQVLTAYSLGLRRVGMTAQQPDNAATRGKIAKISHLVQVNN
ncbi:MAG: 50S ribosomal protein L30 [Oscillospiraceae bacterium]|nr:50S ribosomal protein L30 [Oscillospiraceae bacterium]